MCCLATLIKSQTTFTLSSTQIKGRAKIDSVLIVKDTIIAEKDMKVQGEFKVKGDAKFKNDVKVKGDLNLDGRFNLGNGFTFKTRVSTTAGVGNILTLGPPQPSTGGSNGVDPPPCTIGSVVTGWLNNQSNGYYATQVLGTNTAWYTQYVDGSNGNSYIDATGGFGTPAELRINEKCLNDTYINSLGGIVNLGTTFCKNILRVGSQANTSNGGSLSVLNGGVGNALGVFVPSGGSSAVNAFVVTDNTTTFFKVLGTGKTQVGNGQFLSSNKLLTVNGDVLFANNGISNPAHQFDGYSGFEIVGGDRVPSRRGISVEDDPAGNLSFFVNSNQSTGSPQFRFKNGNSTATNASTIPDAFIINYNGTTKINVSGATSSGSASVLINAFDIFNVIDNKSNFIVKSNGATEILNLNNTVKAFTIKNGANENFLVYGSGQTHIAFNAQIGFNTAVMQDNNYKLNINLQSIPELATPNGIKFTTNSNTSKLIAVSNSNSSTSPFTVNGNGKTQIGGELGNSNAYMLTVNGKIGAREVLVTVANPWPDYVFEKNYKLQNLEAVKKYVLEHKHLPNIPSANDLSKNEIGLNIAEMQGLQMEKIEDIYLYLFEMKKEIETLKKENNELKSLIK